jgi:LuxR family transcriptional regulator, quorum-sensing system regulator BjaR1
VTDHHWAVRALDFISTLDTASTGDGVLKLFREEIARAGFHSLLMTIVNDRERDFSRRVIARFWDPEWVTMYDSEQMTDDDPVRRKLVRATRPFLWSEAQYDPWREPRAKNIMDRAAEFRMRQGLCVPIHHHGGLAAAVNISGDKPDLGRGVRKAMHVMALSTYNRFCALAGPPIDDGNLLTEREREVVRWVSAGKSNWDIGAILNISERTARAHVTNAARKLGVANRTALAVEAVRLAVFPAPR